MISLYGRKIRETGRRLYTRGMIAGSDGNISCRLDNNRILITPSGKCKGRLEADDLVVIDMQGELLAGKNRASSEAAMHTHLYRQRPDILACVHAHPPYATAFAVAGIPLSAQVLPEVTVFVGNIPLADYAPPGTSAVGKSLDRHLKNSNAFLLKNHGLVTIGESLEEAYNRLEMVEHFARILFLSRQLGRVDELDEDEVGRLRKLAESLKSTP